MYEQAVTHDSGFHLFLSINPICDEVKTSIRQTYAVMAESRRANMKVDEKTTICRVCYKHVPWSDTKLRCLKEGRKRDRVCSKCRDKMDCVV